MSWFTYSASEGGKPTCPRCNSPQFVSLVKRPESGPSIYKCSKCGPVVQKHQRTS